MNGKICKYTKAHMQNTHMSFSLCVKVNSFTNDLLLNVCGKVCDICGKQYIFIVKNSVENVKM